MNLLGGAPPPTDEKIKLEVKNEYSSREREGMLMVVKEEEGGGGVVLQIYKYTDVLTNVHTHTPFSILQESGE